MFYQQFTPLMETGVGSATNVEEFLLEILRTKEFWNDYRHGKADRKAEDNAFRCGATGVLLQSEFYRALHQYQNRIRRETIKDIEPTQHPNVERKRKRKSFSHIPKSRLSEREVQIQFGDPIRRITAIPSKRSQKTFVNSGDAEKTFANTELLGNQTKIQTRTRPPEAALTPDSQPTELSHDQLQALLQTKWEKVSERGAWRGLVYCTKEAANELERLRLIQHEYESRPAAREVAKTMTNFLAGFCEPLLGPDTANAILVCKSDEDFHAVATAARTFQTYPDLLK